MTTDAGELGGGGLGEDDGPVRVLPGGQEGETVPKQVGAVHNEVGPSYLGQVDPVKLATLLTELGTAAPGRTRVLEECRVYAGLPSSLRIANPGPMLRSSDRRRPGRAAGPGWR